MDIVIVGAGAIGRLFGALLARGGNRVTLVEKREETVAAINREGIGLMEPGARDPDAVTFIPASALSNAGDIRSCDLVILAVKSFDTIEALGQVAHLAGAGAAFLTIQTGIGNIGAMEKALPAGSVLGGYTYMAATSLGASRVRHGGTGNTVVGELDGTISPRVQRIARTFGACGIATELTSSIRLMIWEKVAVLSAINPITSILRVLNGFLLDHMESITLMKRLVDEAVAVAGTRGIALRADELYDRLFDTCKRTSKNLSSMLQDILDERRTEIDAQNGAICRYAREGGLSVPTHETMVEIIKLVEKQGQRG